MQLVKSLRNSGRVAKVFFASCLALAGMNTSNAQLLITQYYEGTGTNKWIELTNVGSTSIDLSLYSLSHYNNANAEGYKTGVAGNFTVALTGTLAAQTSYVLGNTANTTPVGVTANVNSNTVINFNGNDSIVLWNDSFAYSTAQIVDAIGFTNTGNEGADKSFVRSSLDMGYSLTAGSDVLDFSSVWTQIALATANAATTGTDNYIGYSSLSAASAIPEPSTYAAIFGGLALVGAVVYRRRQAKV